MGLIFSLIICSCQSEEETPPAQQGPLFDNVKSNTKGGGDPGCIRRYQFERIKLGFDGLRT